MNHADNHPTHDRTSCSDEVACNAEAAGSNGCARCTALALDRLKRLDVTAGDRIKMQMDAQSIGYLVGLLPGDDLTTKLLPAVKAMHKNAERYTAMRAEYVEDSESQCTLSEFDAEADKIVAARRVDAALVQRAADAHLGQQS